MTADRSLRHTRIIAAAVLILVVTGCARRSGAPAHEHERTAHVSQVTDTRRQVSLMPAERDAVLAEMRTMLGSISAVLHGVTANDHQAIEKAARASGMAMAVDPTLEQKLPQQFLQMGMATHKKFDQLSDLARTRGPADQVIRSLADVTTICVACHAMYRF
jgi:cytochrome c556